MRLSGIAAVVLGFVGALSWCGTSDPVTPNPSADSVPTRALSDPGTWTYLGFAGGRYPDGEIMPSEHHTSGVMLARAVVPLDGSGAPSSGGRIVLLSIGMSNTTQEFCSGGPAGCAAGSFVGQARADPAVRSGDLVLVDGARGGQTAGTWDEPSDPNYDGVRDNRLLPAGVTERQVQIAWVKVANPQPTVSLPASGADAYRLVGQLGGIARALRVRYPNLKLAFFSNRTYAGYATTSLNPEPYAYESGFAVKWAIQAQITQMAGGPTDPRAGNLDRDILAPWMGWGPDLWANGTSGRADGFSWERGDFAADGTHPAAAGVQKVGRLLLGFFKGSPQTRCWFVIGGVCS
ncbi:MAG: hypothetical protein ACRENB_02340 [Gemmatimonadales bacterium]